MTGTEKEWARGYGEIGKLTLEIDPDRLKRVIEDGRLMELAATMAAEASAQISAQLVEKVAGMAAGGGGGGVSASFVLEGGDFGTIPPRPKFGIGRIRYESLLQRMAAPMVDASFAG